MDKRKGKDKLLKRLKNIYFKIEVLKYALPEEIRINTINVANHNFSSTNKNNFFDFGHENILDFDNSINSLVGCCSLGTGQVVSFIIIYGKFKLSPLLQNDSRS